MMIVDYARLCSLCAYDCRLRKAVFTLLHSLQMKMPSTCFLHAQTPGGGSKWSWLVSPLRLHLLLADSTSGWSLQAGKIGLLSTRLLQRPDPIYIHVWNSLLQTVQDGSAGVPLDWSEITFVLSSLFKNLWSVANSLGSLGCHPWEQSECLLPVINGLDFLNSANFIRDDNSARVVFREARTSKNLTLKITACTHTSMRCR